MLFSLSARIQSKYYYHYLYCDSDCHKHAQCFFFYFNTAGNPQCTSLSIPCVWSRFPSHCSSGNPSITSKAGRSFSLVLDLYEGIEALGQQLLQLICLTDTGPSFRFTHLEQDEVASFITCAVCGEKHARLCLSFNKLTFSFDGGPQIELFPTQKNLRPQIKPEVIAMSLSHTGIVINLYVLFILIRF